MPLSVIQPTDQALVSQLPAFIREDREAIIAAAGGWPAVGILTVKDPRFGAVGNGVADDTDAVELALNTLAIDGGTLMFPPGRYYIKTPFFSEFFAKNVVISGYGATLVCKYINHPDTEMANLAILYPWVDYSAKLSVTSTITKGSRTIVVSSTAALQVGYGVLISSDTQLYSNGTNLYCKGYMSKITKVVSGTTIEVADPAPYNILAEVNILSYYANTPSITIEGFSIEWEGVPDTLTPANQRNCFGSEGTFGLTLRDISYANQSAYGLLIDRHYGTVLSNVRGRGVTGSNYGYGIGVYSATNMVIEDCNIWAATHAIALSRLPSYNVLVRNCFLASGVTGGGYSFDSHIHHYVVVDNCILTQGAKFGGGTIIFRNCKVANGVNLYPFFNRGTCTFNTLTEIDNCDIEVNFTASGAGVFGVEATNSLVTFGDLIIKNNRVYADANVVAFIHGTSKCTSYGTISIANNDIFSVSEMKMFNDVLQSVAVVTPGQLLFHNNRGQNLVFDTPLLHVDGTSAFSTIHILSNMPVGLVATKYLTVHPVNVTSNIMCVYNILSDAPSFTGCTGTIISTPNTILV